MLRGPRSPVGCDGADGSYGTTAYLSRPGRRLLEILDGHTAAYRRTFKIKAHPKLGAPGVSAAST